jgi:hypothetical protein
MENDVKIYGQQDFSLPHDVVKLPSEGKFYKNKKKSVKVGYLTAADENIIMAAKAEDMIMTLLRSKVYEPDLRPDDMMNGDIEAILIFLRNTSFGSEYKIQVTDPETGKRFGCEIQLDELDIKRGEVEPEEDGTFSVELPKSGTSVKIRPLTYKEIMEINKQAESYPVGRVAPKVTWKLQKQIVSINGDETPGTIAKFVDGLPIMDSKFIRNFLDVNEPRLDLRRSVLAPSGEKVTVDVTFGAEFFRVFF